MTLIQPNRSNTILNRILFALVALTAVSAVWLVIGYTTMVDLEHGIAKMTDEIKETEVANAELKEDIFGFFESDSIAGFAASHNLIKDRTPRYVELSQQWPADSRY